MPRSAKVVLVALLLVLAACWVNGFLTLGDLQRYGIPWTPAAVRRVAAYSAGFVVVAAVVERFAGRFGTLAYLAIGLLVGVGSVGFGPVLAVLYYSTSTFLVGAVVARKLGGPAYDGRIEPLLELFLGMSISIALLAPLMWLKVHYPIVYLVVLLVPFLLDRAWHTRIVQFARTFLAEPGESWVLRGARVGLAYFGFLYLAAALLPEVGYDALATHLVVPAEVRTHHLWHFDVGRHVWAVTQMGGDWLFTWVYMLGGEYAARLLNCELALLIVCLVHRLGRRLASRELAALGSLVFLSTPLVLLETGSLFIENFQAGLLACGCVCLLALHHTSGVKYFLLSGVFFGAALSVKLGSLAFVPLPLALVLWEGWRRRHGMGWPVLLIFVPLLVTFAGFPYANAFWRTGNPVFPFANDFFASPLYDTSSPFTQQFIGELSLATLYNVTFSTQEYLECTPGGFGFSFLVLLPASLLLAVARRSYASLTLSAVAVVFVSTVFYGTAYLRYVYPAVPIFIGIFVLALHSTRVECRVAFAILVGFALFSSAMNLAYLPAAGHYQRDLRMDLLFDEGAKRRYRDEKVPVRAAVSYLNEVYGDSVRVGFFAPALLAGLEGVPVTANWHNYAFSSGLARAENEHDYVELFRTWNLTHFIADKNHGGVRKPIIEAVSKQERAFAHDTEVRRIERGALYRRELIKNGDFSEGWDGWLRHGPVRYEPSSQSVSVSTQFTLTQMLPVSAGRTYLLEVTARCDTPETYYRLQVNWFGESGTGLGPSIEVGECNGEFERRGAEFVAPPEAVAGEVYATGHDSKPVEIGRISLRY